MIVRTWRGRTTPDRADDYRRHFASDVLANLAAIPGHRGALLLRRPVEGEVEYLAVTLWDSLETIRAFAGDDIEAAHIEPAGLAALSAHDSFARNYELVCTSVAALNRAAG